MIYYIDPCKEVCVDRKHFIYLITNLVNGKVYVGKSVNPQDRWHYHKKIALGGKEKYSENFSAIHAAIAKYGIDNFSFEIIDEFDYEVEAYKAETKWILLLCSNLKKFGYNCNLGGEGGIVPNEETRQKLIAAQNTPEKLKQKSDLMKKRHEENPGFLSDVHKGNQYTKGMILSEDHKNKISDKLKGRVFSEETRQKMSDSQTGEKHSQAKLTEKDVLEIRKEFSQLSDGKKLFMEEKGKLFGVRPKTIEDIVYRLSWINI